MYSATHIKIHISIAMILYLKKNVACNIKENDSTTISLIVTGNDTDNNSTYDSKKRAS